MVQEVAFVPHVRMLWSNTVDVILRTPGTSPKCELLSKKMGSFTTYGKIMSFVMRFFFGVQFGEVTLNGKVHYVRPKEWEALRRIASTQEDNNIRELLDDAIRQIRGIRTILSPTEMPTPLSADPVIDPVQNEPGLEPARTETPVPMHTPVTTKTETPVLAPVDPGQLGVGRVSPLPQPPVQQKIKILSLCPNDLAIKLSALEAGVLGNEFQPLHDRQEEARSAVLFIPHSERVTISELEDVVATLRLAQTPTAVIYFQYLDDQTRSAEPRFSHDGQDLFNKKQHRTFHVIGTNRGLNKCHWNDQQCKEIRQFLKERLK